MQKNTIFYHYLKLIEIIRRLIQILINYKKYLYSFCHSQI